MKQLERAIQPATAKDTVIVAIGRNEGDRLRLCLSSLAALSLPLVYVDSGSTDRSVELARGFGCSVVELDPARPFSAARARNEGFARALELCPQARFVQFLDGDCELEPGWIPAALAAFAVRSGTAIVCGAVREQHPEASAYNLLCDLEWRRDPGLIQSAGGRFMVRAEAFTQAGGFRDDVIAAEDDEFCLRVRHAGWQIEQLAVAMARHDAAIFSFLQWFRRSRRMGHAYAQVAALHGAGPERYFTYDRRKILFWGLLLPLACILLAPFTRLLTLPVLLFAYALQFLRIAGHCQRRGWTPREQTVYAFFTVIGRFPAILGLLDYYLARALGREHTIIEYKSPSR